MISIRPAVASDARELFDWRNDPVARAASVSQSPVSWPEHELWFESSLASDLRVIYIAHTDDNRAGDSVGMCRLDFEDDGSVEVSINLNPVHRGRGLGREVLQSSIQRLGSDLGREVRLTATIRMGNLASARIFTTAGFSLVGTSNGLNRYERPAN